MRPKKRILLIVADEHRLCVRRFLLETRGYRAIGTCDAAEVIALFEAEPFDLVLSELELKPIDGSALICRLKDMSRDVPMILTSDVVRPGDIAHPADAFLGKGCCSPMELIERVRAMTHRKRGAKKPPASVVPAVVEVAHG